MKKRYEVLLAIDTRGKEENAKETIERIEKDIAAEGAALEQTQRLERKDFSYPHNHLSHAYYVNFVIEAEPAVIARLRAKFKLDGDVTLQNYLVLPPRKQTAEAAA
jgi:small subunit ribosomal protein S6